MGGEEVEISSTVKDNTSPEYLLPVILWLLTLECIRMAEQEMYL